MSSDAVWTDDTHQILFFKEYNKKCIISIAVIL